MSEIAPAFVLPVRVSVVAGAARREGWRATLQTGDRIVWRCDCRPHRSRDAALRCGAVALRKRQAHSDQRNTSHGAIPTNLSNPEGRKRA